MMIYMHAFIKALLNSPIIDEHYLIIHTYSGATAHSSCVAGGVASLLLPYSEVAAADDPYAGWQTSQCGSSLQSLLD
jgi:hypothetical protein